MRYSFLMTCVFFADIILAQSNLHTVSFYTTKNGLNSDAIACIMQDTRGFLWIGTKEGLNRFDGFEFKKYFSEKNNPGSLTHNNVTDILEYKPGQLLIATGNGLSVLNTLTGKFENEKIKFAELKAGLGNTIYSLYKDKQSNIWVNYNGELDVLDSNLNYLYRFTDLNWAKNCRGALINCENWQTDKKNRLWFLSDTSGINILDIAEKKVFNAKNNPEKIPYLRYPYLRSFLIDEQNNAVWYAPWGKGLFKYDLLSHAEKQISFGILKEGEMRTINSIVKTDEGNVLCFIGGKCFEINCVTLRYKEVAPITQNQFNTIAATTILKTGDEQYWVGNKGLLLLNKKKEVYKEVPVLTTGKCTNMFISSSGRLYSSYTNNLIVVTDKNKGSFFTYKLQGIQNNIFTAISEDKHNNIWVGSNKGIFLFDDKSKTFSQPSFLPDELRHHKINIIYADHDGDLWIGTRDSFLLYHYATLKSKFERIDDEVIKHFASFGINSRISNIASDKYGNLWMTSRLGGGIICYEKKRNKWRLYSPAGKNYEFLQNRGFASVYADEHGFLWLSDLKGDGLIQYNYVNDSINKFTRSDGLQSDYIQNICGDNAGKLWLITAYGITDFNTKTLRTESNISLPGILPEEQQGILDPSTNNLILALPNRLLFVSTAGDTVSEQLPVPVIDKIIVNNQQQFFDPQAQKLTLNYEQKNIAIDFTAINFSNKKIHFAYKLSGIDKDWKFADENRNVQYSILSTGDYSFIVKTGNEQGQWSRAYKLFSFIITPPWWKTWWFIALCILATGCLIFVWIRAREKNIKSRTLERANANTIIQQAQMQLAGQQHKMAKAEMHALRAQMNPHFLFNSLNSINNYILKSDADNAAGYLTKFSRLMRLILDNSRSNWVFLENEIKALELYVELESFRFDQSFTYEINIETNVHPDSVIVPPMVIQPYVENAIWHGLMHQKKSGGHLQINIYKENENLCISVKDNGIGRDAANRLRSRSANNQKSHGMKITAERLEIMNKVYDINARVSVTDMADDGSNATGTIVLIIFKYIFKNEPVNL